MSRSAISPGNTAAKTAGLTRYIHDLQLPGQLIGGILRSPHPHARITRLDVSKARQIDGVVAVLTGKDVPGQPYGPTKYKDWNILARDRVLFIGDEIAAVAAETREAVEQALAAIEIEFEELPAVFDPEQSLQETAPILHEHAESNRPMHLYVERGDVEAARRRAHIVRRERYYSNRIYQGYLEPLGVAAQWSEEDGLTLWAPSHIPYRARETYAEAFGLPEERVRIIVPPMGGSFGGKYVSKLHVIAAALAMRTKRPVKIILDRREDMLVANPRVPLIMDVEIGADEEGHFLYKEVRIFADAGARVYWSPNVLVTACTRVDSIYHFQNVRADGHLCYTNNSPTTCMRGFGNAEALYAVENVIDDLAEGLGMDPAELRLKNIVHQGETTIHGYRLDSCKLDECIRKVIELSHWERRDSLPPYRGLGIAVANHVSGYSAIDPRFDGSTASVRLNLDGSFDVETGEIEIGQGMTAAYARIASRVLAVDENSIHVRSGDTGRYPFGIGTLASRSTVFGGNAVLKACAAMRARIEEFAREILGTSAEFRQGQIIAEGKSYSLQELSAWYRSRHAGELLVVRESYLPETELPDETYYGHPSPNYPFAAHVAEVEVDPESGRVKVIGYWAVHDSGTIIHPTLAKSQVIGAVAQGIGWATMEDFIVQEGKVQNPSMMDYRIPGVRDVPPVEVCFLEEPDPHGPFGAKSLGEVALDPVPAAITNAIAHAIGKRGTRLPMTPEQVWRLLHPET